MERGGGRRREEVLQCERVSSIPHSLSAGAGEVRLDRYGREESGRAWQSEGGRALY